jgi:hypothetical protein
VSSRRRVARRGGRALGIGILILSVIRIPLPQADYHNIRHHDAPGEVCLYHDHLLRWHPSADSNDDVSLLHWHWSVPLVELPNHYQGANDEHHRPASGPALHAHLGDWPEPYWRAEPVIRPDARGRFLEQFTLGLSAPSSTYLSAQLAPLNPASGRFSAGAGCADDGLRAARIALFQRWNC